MCNKHGKNQYKTMIFAFPSQAQHLTNNKKKQPTNHPQILSKWCPEPFQTRIRKTPTKTHPQEAQKYRELTILRSPRNKERTRSEQTFGDFFASGRPWATLGGPDGPKTFPKSLRDSPGPQFWMIFDAFFDDVVPSVPGEAYPCPPEKTVTPKSYPNKNMSYGFPCVVIS